MSNIVPESTDVMYSVSMNDTRLRWTSKVVGNSICAGQHISVSLEFYICMFTNMSKNDFASYDFDVFIINTSSNDLNLPFTYMYYH